MLITKYLVFTINEHSGTFVDKSELNNGSSFSDVKVKPRK